MIPISQELMGQTEQTARMDREIMEKVSKSSNGNYQKQVIRIIRYGGRA